MSDTQNPADESPSDATPVVPAPAEESPSSTGLVDGDGTEPDRAKPSKNQGDD